MERCRLLTLDGGGAKGFYSLGVLKELEAVRGRRLHEEFDLIFGTSTGAIIAALLCLGLSVDEILGYYKKYVPVVMAARTRRGRTNALQALAVDVFKSAAFGDAKTRLGIVATRWKEERPMIFKSHAGLAHGLKATFVPGFGVSISDAVQASCAAYPFFERKVVETADGSKIELIDGGYCANNPTLYAISDAVNALGVLPNNVRVMSVGVGEYPKPRKLFIGALKAIPFNSIELLQKTLEINTQSMDQLRLVLFGHVPSIRISDVFSEPEMATDLLEHDLTKLSRIREKGRFSFARREAEVATFFD
jgi:patatin-like phospholipase/acyl hydrolase